MKSRKEFEAKAIREAERRLEVPAGWWGAWRHVRGPEGVEVVLSSSHVWAVRQRGKTISRHDSRQYAIKRARRIASA